MKESFSNIDVFDEYDGILNRYSMIDVDIGTNLYEVKDLKDNIFFSNKEESLKKR